MGGSTDIRSFHDPVLKTSIKGKTIRALQPQKLRDPVGDQFDAFLAEHLRMVSEGASTWVRFHGQLPLLGEMDEHLCSIFVIRQKDRFRAIFNMKFSNYQMSQAIQDDGCRKKYRALE